MNKLLYFFFLIYCSVFYAQDTASAFKKKSVFASKDLIIDNDSISKVTFRPNFKNQYSSEEFVYETKLAKKNAWDRFVEWFKGQLARLFNIGNNETTSNIIDIIFKTIAVLIVIFVIYLIVKSILNKEGQWIFGRNSDRSIINYDDIEKNLQVADFEKLIESAIQNGQIRLSIRYYYLYLLKILSQQEIIVWDIEKTNSDYTNEIQDTKLKQEFLYLSYLYNNIWYGEFDVDAETFQKSKTAFESTIKSLKR